jgi:hypothetical protein
MSAQPVGPDPSVNGMAAVGYCGQQWRQKSSLAPIGSNAFSPGATVHNNKFYAVIADAAGAMSGDFTSKFFSGNRNSGERMLNCGWIRPDLARIQAAGFFVRPAGLGGFGKIAGINP